MKDSNLESILDVLIDLTGKMLIISLVLYGLYFLIIAYRVYQCPESWKIEYKDQVMRTSGVLLILISATIVSHTFYEVDESNTNVPSSNSSIDKNIIKERQDL